MIYDWQERDFTRELANSYNQFALWLDKIDVWEQVLRNYSEDEVLELRMEFTTIPLDYCLTAPYKFKSQIAFCATQLCYTQGIERKLISKESVLSDDKINVNALAAVAKYWNAGKSLVAALQEIDAQQYRELTANYRNRTQHRHPQRLDHGHTANVERSFPQGSLVSYTFGETLPLATGDVLPILVAEAARLKAAFMKYRMLVDEHIDDKIEG